MPQLQLRETNFGIPQPDILRVTNSKKVNRFALAFCLFFVLWAIMRAVAP